MCENARVYIAEAEMIKSGDRQPGDVNYEPLKRKSAKIVVVIGHACSTALEVATALLPRLPNGSAHAIADYSEWSSRDLSDISAEVGNRIRTAAENLTSSGCVLLSLLISDGLAADLLLLLEQCIQSASSKSDFNLEVKFVLTVVASYHMEAVPALPTDCSCEKYHLSNNRCAHALFSCHELTFMLLINLLGWVLNSSPLQFCHYVALVFPILFSVQTVRSMVADLLHCDGT